MSCLLYIYYNIQQHHIYHHLSSGKNHCHLSSPHENIQLVLLSFLLCDFYRSKNAPFEPSLQTHDFPDKHGTYNNKYATHTTTIQSTKNLDPELPSNFQFKDYMKLAFNFETHPHIFLLAILQIGFHNPKFGIATSTSPYVSIFIVLYIIHQFEFYTIPQFILMSNTMYKILKMIQIPISSRFQPGYHQSRTFSTNSACCLYVLRCSFWLTHDNHHSKSIYVNSSSKNR